MTKYKTFVIRLQVKVGSQEEALLEFLNDEDARPFSKSQMVLLALKAFWLTLSLLHQNRIAPQVSASFHQAVYLWKLQEQYLRKLAGIDTDLSIVVPDVPQTSITSAATDLQPTNQPVFNPFGENVISNF